MKIELRIIIYITGLIGVIFTTIISYNLSIIKNEKIIIYYRPSYLNVFFYSIAIFIFSKNYFNQKKILIQKLAKFTFGIYLIHPFIIENIIKKTNIFDFGLDSVLLIPIINLIVFLLSLLTCIILNSIPLIGKLLF